MRNIIKKNKSTYKELEEVRNSIERSLKRDKKTENQIFVALPITLNQSIVIMEAKNSLNSDASWAAKVLL